MASPYLYAALSIIPGLGLLALREYRQASVVIGSMVALGFLTFYVGGEFFGGLFLIFFFMVWLMQAKYTFQLAKREYAVEIGESNLKPVEKVIVPPGLPLKEKNRIRRKEQLRQQLNPGEELQYHFMGTRRSFWFPFMMYQYLVGVTASGVVIVSLDITGQPSEVSRHQIHEIEGFKLSGGPMNIKTHFWVSGIKKPMVLLVTKMFFSDELEKLEETFSAVNR